MELKDLIGIHRLSGFDTSIPDKKEGENYIVCYEDGVCFIIDGKKYQIYTDGSDGYRSYLTELYEDDSVNCCNTFDELVFIANVSDIDEDKIGIIIYSLEGKIIAEIYTDRSDDWYPYAVCRWYPDNLLLNKNNIEQEKIDNV